MLSPAAASKTAKVAAVTLAWVREAIKAMPEAAAGNMDLAVVAGNWR